jgi:hypothetical protein
MQSVGLSLNHGLTLLDLVEKHAANQSPSRIEELVKIFIHATKVSRKCKVEVKTADLVTDGNWLLGYGFRRMKSFHPQSCQKFYVAMLEGLSPVEGRSYETKWVDIVELVHRTNKIVVCIVRGRRFGCVKIKTVRASTA